MRPNQQRSTQERARKLALRFVGSANPVLEQTEFQHLLLCDHLGQWVQGSIKSGVRGPRKYEWCPSAAVMAYILVKTLACRGTEKFVLSGNEAADKLWEVLRNRDKALQIDWPKQVFGHTEDGDALARKIIHFKKPAGTGIRYAELDESVLPPTDIEVWWDGDDISTKKQGLEELAAALSRGEFLVGLLSESASPADPPPEVSTAPPSPSAPGAVNVLPSGGPAGTNRTAAGAAGRPSRSIPYDPARPAAEGIFVGRASSRALFVEGLTLGKSYGLIGGPGMGKTSLLFAVQRELARMDPERAQGELPLPIYLDCTRNRQESVETILTAVVKSLVDGLHNQRKVRCPPDVHARAEAEAGQRRLQAALKQVHEWASTQYRPILLLDDLHRIGQRPWLAELASILQTAVNEHELALVLTGRRALAEELRDDTSPLRLLLSGTESLGPLSEQETAELVGRAQNQGWEVDAGVTGVAYGLTGGHPYRLHYYLLGALQRHGKLSMAGLEKLHADPGTAKHLDPLLRDD
jgi:AAA domain